MIANVDRTVIGISIHAPRVRCDLLSLGCRLFTGYISIHAPRVRCDFVIRCISPVVQWYFNPRTSCEVRPLQDHMTRQMDRISIHAPRVRCDKRQIQKYWKRKISIHAPRVRCDNQLQSCFLRFRPFQSTHLV